MEFFSLWIPPLDDISKRYRHTCSFKRVNGCLPRMFFSTMGKIFYKNMSEFGITEWEYWLWFTLTNFRVSEFNIETKVNSCFRVQNFCCTKHAGNHHIFERKTLFPEKKVSNNGRFFGKRNGTYSCKYGTGHDCLILRIQLMNTGLIAEDL